MCKSYVESLITCSIEDTERHASGAGNSWSDEGAEAISSRLHAFVRCGPDWDRALHGPSTLRGV